MEVIKALKSGLDELEINIIEHLPKSFISEIEVEQKDNVYSKKYYKMNIPIYINEQRSTDGIVKHSIGDTFLYETGDFTIEISFRISLFDGVIAYLFLEPLNKIKKEIIEYVEDKICQ